MSYSSGGAFQTYRAGVPSLDTLVDPATISGAKAWWKASSIAQSDSTAVTTWTDSISSIAPTQATAGNKPTYRTTQGPNSTPCVSFDGGDWLSVNVLGSNLWSAQQGHVFLVMKQTGSDAQNTAFGWYNGASNTINAYLTYDDVLYWDWSGTGASARVSVAQPSGWDDNWRLVQLIRETGTSRIRVQGSELVSGSVSSSVDTSLTAPFSIASLQSTGSTQLTGFIADILIYNVALGTTDRQSVEAWFNSLYTLF